MGSTCINFFLPKYCILSVCHLAVANLWKKASPFKTFLLLKEQKSFKKKLRLREKKNDLVNYSYVFTTNMVVKCKGFLFKEISSFFFHAGFVWTIGLERKWSCLSIPAFECASFFFTKVALSVEKKGLKASVVSVSCVIYLFQRLRSFILGLTIEKKKSLITLTKKKVI